jgi:cytochrome c peroxidase
MLLKPVRCIGAVVALAALLAACATDAPDPSAMALRDRAAPLFGTVAAVTPAEVSAPAATLGRALFWDTRLSVDGKTACASCHPREAWSADPRRLSVNAKGQLTTLHSQPMFMAQDQSSLRWYGDRKDGQQQAERSISGSMGMPSAAEMVPLLRRHGYEAAFAQAFAGPEDPVTPANYGKALQAYQRTLRTPAPFDDFLAGKLQSLDKQQRAGLEKFVATGCAGCHNGPLFGGRSLQKFGLVKDYWLVTGSKVIDLGRFNATQKEEDKYVYRVPMLRNIAKTAPYFHDGSVDTLEAAVRVMGEVQLGRTLPDADVADIVAFLGSLTGAVPAHYAAP